MGENTDTPGWLLDIAGLSTIALTWYHTLTQPPVTQGAAGTATVTTSPGTVQVSASPLLVLVGAGAVLWLLMRK